MTLPQARRVIVTGGAGFIGHRVVDRLQSRGLDVAIVDNLSVGMPMPQASARVSPHQVDIRDREALDAVFEAFRPDAVIHLAAVHHIPTCERERAYAQDANIVGTEQVLASCERFGVGFAVIASSGAVYAPIEGELIEDETPHEVIDNYSLCKIANEAQARLWASRTGGSVRAARIFNTVGHDDPNGHLIPDILAQIPAGAVSATISLGNTTPRRDYIHADDTADGLVAMLTAGEVRAPVEAFNVCRGEELSVTDILAVIGRHMGVELSTRTDPSRIRRVDRPSLLGSTRKTRDRLGWAARHDFKALITHTLEGVAGARDLRSDGLFRDGV